MKRSRFNSPFAGLLTTAGLFCLIAMFQPQSADAQGFSIGPGGVSIGGAYIPFNNGRTEIDDRYGPNDPSDRNRNYGPRDNYGRGYNNRDPYGRGYGRSDVYWTPGRYWSPNEYWYGDRDWSRYDEGYSGVERSNTRGGILSELGARLNVQPALPPVPSLEELERMNWVHLRRVMSYGSTQLEQELAQQRTGGKWVDYLGVQRLQQIVDNEENIGPTSTEANELVGMLEHYNQTADDTRYRTISGLWGFETVHRSLAEFLVNPASRYRRQLVMNSEDLDRALERFATGAGWQHHLMLPAELFLDPVEADKNPPDAEELRKALQKYDEVAKNRDYRVVNELPAFQATHQSLARYLGRAEPPQANTVADDDPLLPPADPSLNEPKPIDPPVANKGDKPDSAKAKTPKEPGQAKSILKQSKPQVEELLPPPKSDSPAGNTPAVREKQ